MPPATTPRQAAEQELAEPLWPWIDRYRQAGVSYAAIARLLARDTGVTVTQEAVRLWHVAAHPQQSAEAGAA